MWSVTTCFCTACSSDEADSTDSGHAHLDAKTCPPFWIFLACSSSVGTHFTQSSPYLDESEQKLWDFSVIIHRLSVIGHLNLGGVAWCLKQSVNLQCHVQPRRTNVEINIPRFFHQEAKFKTHFYISGDFDKMQFVQQVLHLHVHDISKHGRNRASMSLNTTKVPTSR